MTENAGFHGSVPTFYDRYLGPFMFESYAEALAERLPRKDGTRVLEIACGTGIGTERLLRKLPRGGTLVATDLTEAMLDFARQKVADPKVEWRAADMLALPFDAGSFDAVVCGFGLMFVPDKGAALAEARRVLAPGGTYLATTWGSLQELPAIRAMHERLLAMHPANPPRFLETPYGFGDAAFWRKGLASAGFARVSVERIHSDSEAKSAEDVATGFIRGTPLFPALQERGADHDHVVREVAAALAAVGGERPFRTPLHALLLEAS